MKSSKTQTSRIRQAMAKNPSATPKQIADQLGIKARAVHMVRYLDRKKSGPNPPKYITVTSKTPKTETFKPTTPAPAWAKRNLSNEMDAVKQRIEEIKAANPDSGARLTTWEIVGICLSVAFCVEVARMLLVS